MASSSRTSSKLFGRPSLRKSLDSAYDKAAAEIHKVQQLKQALEEAGAFDASKHDDHALRRFLRARNWSVELARVMWLASIKWRGEVGADDMLDQEVLSPERKKRLLSLFPHGLHGVDTVGRPVLVYRLGATQLSDVLSEFDEATLQRFHVQLFEFIMRVAMPAASLAAGHHIDTLTTLFDIKGLSLWDMKKIQQLLVPTMSITRDNYPETLGQVLIVNAPMIFDSAYSVGKRMLTVETQRKIQVTGGRFEKLLFSHIHRDNVHVTFGGNSNAGLGDHIGPWQQLIHTMEQPTATSRPSADIHADAAASNGDMTLNGIASPESRFYSFRTSFNSAAGMAHGKGQDDGVAGGSPTASLPGYDRPSLHGVSGIEEEMHASNASFHSCLSLAEASRLSSYLAAPNHVFAHMPETVPEADSVRERQGGASSSTRTSTAHRGSMSRAFEPQLPPEPERRRGLLSCFCGSQA